MYQCSGSALPDPYVPHPDPLVRGTDPRIRIQIRNEMSRIRNTALNLENYILILFSFPDSVPIRQFGYFLQSSRNSRDVPDCPLSFMTVSRALSNNYNKKTGC
jgi:hypothetical protein